MKKICTYLLFFTYSVFFSQSEIKIDTVEISLSNAEEFFVKNNYLLLAQKYNIDASKAIIKQAGLFNNPTVYYENNIRNRYSGRYFPTQAGTIGDYTTQGEFVIQYNWLFSIAGKRNKSIKLAKSSADLTQYQFDDLVRTLLFTLRSDFYTLYYDLKSLKLYDEQIASISKIVSDFESQYQKGNISLKDITRVRALLFSLQNDRLDLTNELQQLQSEFSILINNSKTQWYKPILNETEALAGYPINKVVLSNLISESLQNRPDLKVAKSQVDFAEANLKLQKAIGVPDILVQGVFDRNGSYIQNYNALALSVPVPVFNRNQGNIKSAGFLVEAANKGLQEKQVYVQNEIFATYQKILEINKLSNQLSPNYSDDFISLLKGAQINYEKKNLSIIEFTDLFESYKLSMTQYFDLKAKQLVTFEELILKVGKNVFK